MLPIKAILKYSRNLEIADQKKAETKPRFLIINVLIINYQVNAHSLDNLNIDNY